MANKILYIYIIDTTFWIINEIDESTRCPFPTLVDVQIDVSNFQILFVVKQLNLNFLANLWNGLEQVCDETVVGHLENRGLGVLIDSYDRL